MTTESDNDGIKGYLNSNDNANNVNEYSIMSMMIYVICNIKFWKIKSKELTFGVDMLNVLKIS